jgi:hypothetical protein
VSEISAAVDEVMRKAVKTPMAADAPPIPADNPLRYVLGRTLARNSRFNAHPSAAIGGASAFIGVPKIFA